MTYVPGNVTLTSNDPNLQVQWVGKGEVKFELMPEKICDVPKKDRERILNMISGMEMTEGFIQLMYYVERLERRLEAWGLAPIPKKES